MHISYLPRRRRFAIWRQLREILPVAQISEIQSFLIVGGLAALAYAALNTAFVTWGGLRPSLAILAALGLLIPPTYLAQHRLTFQSGRKHSAAFPRYVGTQLVGNALAFSMAALFAGKILDKPFLAFSTIAVGVAATNYVFLKFWAFRSGK